MRKFHTDRNGRVTSYDAWQGRMTDTIMEVATFVVVLGLGAMILYVALTCGGQ